MNFTVLCKKKTAATCNNMEMYHCIMSSERSQIDKFHAAWYCLYTILKKVSKIENRWVAVRAAVVGQAVSEDHEKKWGTMELDHEPYFPDSGVSMVELQPASLKWVNWTKHTSCNIKLSALKPTHTQEALASSLSSSIFTLGDQMGSFTLIFGGKKFNVLSLPYIVFIITSWFSLQDHLMRFCLPFPRLSVLLC